MPVLRFLAKTLRWLRPRQPPDVAEMASKLAGQLPGPCPTCVEPTSDHESLMLGSAIAAAGAGSLAALEAAICRRDWAAAASVQEFDARQDMVSYHLLRCPATGRVSLLRHVSHYDLYAQDGCDEFRVLDPDEAREAAAVAPGRWKRLDEQAAEIARLWAEREASR